MNKTALPVKAHLKASTRLSNIHVTFNQLLFSVRYTGTTRRVEITQVLFNFIFFLIEKLWIV